MGKPKCLFWNPKKGDEHYICDAGQCSYCDAIRSELVLVDRETASQYLGGYAVYFKTDDGRMAFRTWWSHTNGHWHQLPESDELWVKQSAVDDRKRKRLWLGIILEPAKMR